MNLGIASYITSAGLKAVTSAGALGPYFAIKYFLPIYDYRIDKTICREISGSTSALSVSSLNLVSATHSTLYGEKIYSNADYDVSNNSYLFWKSSMGSLPDGVNYNVSAQQSVTTDVNTYLGKPLSVVVSGSKFVSPSTGVFNISGTHIVSGAELSTLNPLSASTWPTSAFYRVAGYSPNANGNTSATGTFKCRIPPTNSSFKFNGLALYAVKVDANGFDDYGNGTNFGFNPTLFSVVLFDQAQYKEKDIGGVNDFEISVDLNFDWNAVSSGTTNIPRYIETNHWVKVPTATSTSAYALNYDGDVVISSSAVAGSYAPKAKLTVVDPTKQQLRLANDNERFTDFRTIRFANDLTGPVPNSTNRAVLSIDTSCPDDALLQLGYKTSAVGIKSVAIGCYSSAVGYMNGGVYDFTDQTPVDNDSITNTTGGYTVAIGVKNYAEGFGSVSLGFETSSIGYLNFGGGEGAIASYGAFDPSANRKDGLNFAYGKEVSAISRTDIYSYFDYTSDSILADDESYGSNIAFGVRSLANGGLSFVNGAYVSALGVNSFGLGYKTLAKGHFSFVGGTNSSALSDFGFSFGNNVESKSPYGFAYGRNVVLGGLGNYSSFNVGIGENISATEGSHSIVMGSFARSNGLNSIAIGQNHTNENLLTVANGINSIAVGNQTSALGKNSLSIGVANLSESEGSISLGGFNNSTGTFSVALGYKNSSTALYSFAANGETSAIGAYSTSFGYKTVSEGDYSFSINEESSATGRGSFSGGFKSLASGAYSFAFGNLSKAINNGSVAIGNEAEATHENSVAIGSGAITTENNQIVIGSCDDTVVIKGSKIDIGCGNVNIPGINQFNDSINFDVSMTGPDTGANSSNRRTMIIKIVRSGTVSKLEAYESSYNSCVFNVVSVVGSFKAILFGTTTTTIQTINATDSLYMNRFINMSYGGVTLTKNLFVSLDKLNNDVLLSFTEFSGPSVAETTLITMSYFMNNRIYEGQLNSSTADQDRHYFYWQQNVNIITSYLHYDKVHAGIETYFDTNKVAGDGICSYKFDTRTVGEWLAIKIGGIDNAINSSTSNYYSATKGQSNFGHGVKLIGTFINSGNTSFGFGYDRYIDDNV